MKYIMVHLSNTLEMFLVVVDIVIICKLFNNFFLQTWIISKQIYISTE